VETKTGGLWMEAKTQQTKKFEPIKKVLLSPIPFFLGSPERMVRNINFNE